MKVTTRYQKDYDGGLNDTASSLEIADNEASLLRNWLIRTEGKLTRRPGLTQVGDDLTGAATGAHAYLRSGGGKDFLVMDDDSLKYLNGSTFAALDDGFTAGQSFAMETCPVNDKVYISNEDNTTHSWDRAATTLNSCLTDLGNTKYQANIMRWHKRRATSASSR